MKAIWVLLVVCVAACNGEDECPHTKLYGTAIDLERNCITDNEVYIGCYDLSGGANLITEGRCCHSLERGILYCMPSWGVPGSWLVEEEGWSEGATGWGRCELLEAEQDADAGEPDPSR